METIHIPKIEATWVGGHNGHWMIYVDGEFECSCDDSELSSTIRDI